MSQTPLHISTKPPCHRDDALAVLKRLRQEGHVAYFAGGCVRDELLGIEPKDYDVATDASPQRVQELFSHTQAVGAAFGVILVHHAKSVVEVVTFRSDDVYLDGRRPSKVHFTNAEEDAKRRDFTINGLFLDPITNQTIDYVGGLVDLSTRTLRAIGDPHARFREDHLRLLRAIRFAARFDLTIEPNTADAIRAHAQHLKGISPERIAEELRLMLTPPTRVKAWELLWQFQLVHVVLRMLPEKPQHSAALFPRLVRDQSISFGLTLAALTLCYRHSDPNAPPLLALFDNEEVRRSVRTCRTSLKISNDEEDLMKGVLHLAPLLRDEPPSVAQMKRFLARSYSKDARLLLAAIFEAFPDLSRIVWLRERFEELDKTDVAPPPLVTGDDLVAAGLQPGKLFKQVLNEVYDAQLESRVASRDQAMSLAMSLAQKFREQNGR